MVGWAGLIFILSHTPNLHISDGPSDYWLRKTAHLVVYAILFLLFYRALLKQSFTNWHMQKAMLAILLTVLYGMSDEFHQSLVPTRHGSWVDVGIDGVGALVAFIGLAWWGWWHRVLREVDKGGG